MKFADWLERGYDTLVSIAPPGADIDDAGKTPARLDTRTGKWFAPKGWTEYRVDPSDLDAWEKWGANLGLVNRGQFFILDIDAYDEDRAGLIERTAKAMFGPAPRRVGEWPKRTLLYRAAELIPGRNISYAEGDRTDQVQILGKGKQTVVQGIHPKTKAPFQWDQDLPRFEDLSEVTLTQVDEFIDKLKRNLPQAHVGSGASDGPAKDPETLKGDHALVRDALSRIPNVDLDYEDYITVGQAVRGAFGPGSEDEAYEVWDEWSRKSPKYDDALNQKHWRTMGSSRTLGAQYIYERAAKHGWDRIAEAFFQPYLSDPQEQAPAKPERPPLVAGEISLNDLDTLPPREWLYGFKISRKYVTFMAAPGGAGKTALAQVMALSAATGQAFLHDKPVKPLRVWVLNLEDDIIEMKRRLKAAMIHYGLGPEVLENIRFNSGRDRRFTIVRRGRDENYIIEPDYRAVIDEMKRCGIDLLIVDPFLRSHQVPENDNEAQDEVMRLYAQIAQEANAGVLLIHHVKKGAVAGDMDSMRGGSTQGGGARSVLTLASMTAEEAKAAGIDEKARRLYVRIDDAKNNMAPPLAKAEWIKLESVSLGNGTPDYPEGDHVQVATKYSLPGIWDGADASFETAALEAIGKGLPDGERYSERSQDGERWAGTVLVGRFGRSKAQADEILKGWKKQGWIKTMDYMSTKQRKTRKGLVVDGGFPVDETSIFD